MIGCRPILAFLSVFFKFLGYFERFGYILTLIFSLPGDHDLLASPMPYQRRSLLLEL